MFGAEFAGGDGTKDNPWKIKTREQLAALNNYLGSKGSGRYFCLSSDILFSAEDFAVGGEFYNKGLGWLPIGTQSETNKMFRGSLDGRGHVIQNLTINRPQTPDIGLFGYTRGAIIKDLRLENLTFTGSTNVGGLTGTDRGSTFQNVSVTGTVNGQKTIGGLVGYAENTILTRCGSDCQVSASLLSMNYTEISSAGGLMGYGQEVEAAECYALGNLSCTTSSYEGKTSGYIYAGGLIGCLKSGSVARSFAKSIVSGSTAAPSSAGDAYVGGLVGYLHVSMVEDCYTQGHFKVDARVELQNTDISGNDTGNVFAGGIAGFGVTSSITRSYSSMESTVYAGPGGGSVGGLVGTISFGTIGNSVAVNPVIHVYSEAAKPEAGRVSGIYTGTLSNNLASAAMVVVRDEEVLEPVDDASYKDGATTILERLKTKIPYKTLGWDVENVWDQEVGNYPYLVWEPEVFDIKEAVITVQPQSVKVKAGETAVFSVTAEGSRLSYIWYHDEKIIRDENENVLMIENAQVEDEGTYRVYVFNSLGGVMSSPAELTLKGSGPVSAIWLRNPEYVEDESGAAYFLFDVEGAAVFSVEGSFNATDWTEVSYTLEGGKVKIPASYNYVLYRAWAEASYDEEAPKIIVQPQNTKVKEGEKLTLSVVATGSAPLSYQWIFEGLKIEGATNSVYEVEAAQAGDAGRYIVTITNPYGSVTSSIATVRVTGITPVPVPPVITGQPQDVTVDEGSSFTLSVTANGTEPLAYQWFKDGAAIEGATASVYEVAMAHTWDSGSYTVSVSNVAGQIVSREALVTVNKIIPPTPIDELELIYREIREIDGVYYFVFDVEGSSVYFIDGSRDGINWESIEYKTLPDGGVIFPMTEDFILYRARAENVVPPVVEPPTITQQPQDVTVNEGNSFMLSVTATGTEPLAYQWFKDGTEIEGATASVYEVTTAQTGDSGSYAVRVSNEAGQVVSREALVTVNKIVPPTPTDKLELFYREVREIDGAYYLVFDVKGSSVYFIDGSRDGINWVPVEYETLTDGGVIFPMTEDFILYRARAENVIPPVDEPPTITQQPQDVTVDEGSSFVLSVTATGTEPLTYQWFKDGTALEGATASVYEVTTAQTSDSGVYTVRVSNIAGSVNSSDAIVKVESVAPVIEPPVIKYQPHDVTVNEGDTILLSVTVTGSEPLYYQWFKDGNPISGLSARIRIGYINGYSGLNILQAKKSDSGHYTVTVSNEAGTVTSRTAVVTVNGGIVYSDLVYREVRKIDGEKYLVFDVSGSSDYQIESSENGTTWKQVECEHLDDGGIIVPMTERFMLYRAVTDKSIKPTIKIVTQPEGGTFKVGETIRLSVTVEGAASYYYQWYKDGNILWDATSSELVISDAKESDSGSYVVKVAGMESSWNPVIDSDPAVVTVVAEPHGDGWLQNGEGNVDEEGNEYFTFDIVNAEIIKVEKSFDGKDWVPAEYSFPSLKVLRIESDLDAIIYMVTGLVDGQEKWIQFIRQDDGNPKILGEM